MYESCRIRIAKSSETPCLKDKYAICYISIEKKSKTLRLKGEYKNCCIWIEKGFLGLRASMKAKELRRIRIKKSSETPWLRSVFAI